MTADESPNDATLLQRLCYMSAEPELERFLKLGFLEHDATPTAPRRQRDANVTPRRRQHDAPEAEAETDRYRERSPPNPPRDGWGARGG